MPSPDRNTDVETSVQEGYLHVLVAFDIGFEIKLKQIPDLFSSRARDPVGYNFLNRSFGRDTTPIRLVFDSVTLILAERQRTFQAYATFFDIGAISLELICEIDESIDQLAQLAIDVQNSRDLPQVAQRMAEDIFRASKDAIVTADFVNTPSIFTIFNIRGLSQRLSADQVKSRFGVPIAQTLRLSMEPIGKAEIDRTLNPCITYSDEDIVFVSSNVALVFDETSSEVIDVFELLNVQSLELRFIDAKLDRTLHSLYEESDRKQSWWSKFFDLFEAQSRKLNTIHLDSTIIVERVEQSYKFASDSYLVRIYELCVNKMFLNLFSTGIDKKLVAIRDILTDHRDRNSSTRMEILEWIVIVLIAVDVVPKILSLVGFHQ